MASHSKILGAADLDIPEASGFDGNAAPGFDGNTAPYPGF